MRISNEANGGDQQVHAIRMLAGSAYCLTLSMKAVDQAALLLLFNSGLCQSLQLKQRSKADTDLLSLLEFVFPGGIHRSTRVKTPFG